jgi:regulator of nonsense transcripts 1
LASDLSQGASSQVSDDASLTKEIVILTPYTRQREFFQKVLPTFTVSSIDGFRGREAKIVIFVTVRSNASYGTGFLKDLRRLNVAMTRAKAGIVIIGNRMTLTGRGDEEVDTTSKDVWKRPLDQPLKFTLQLLQLNCSNKQFRSPT